MQVGCLSSLGSFWWIVSGQLWVPDSYSLILPWGYSSLFITPIPSVQDWVGVWNLLALNLLAQFLLSLSSTTLVRSVQIPVLFEASLHSLTLLRWSRVVYRALCEQGKPSSNRSTLLALNYSIAPAHTLPKYAAWNGVLCICNVSSHVKCKLLNKVHLIFTVFLQTFHTSWWFAVTHRWLLL